MVDRQIGKWSVIQRVEEEEDTEEKIRLQARWCEAFCGSLTIEKKG